MNKLTRHKKARNEQVTQGSGNVFTDLGFGPEEATQLQVKAELTRLIYHRLQTLGLTQVEASKRMGISQPDVSKLMRARFTGFSTDRLLSMLSALDVDIDIVVRPRTAQGRGIVRVRKGTRAA
jgi:predicted XRE-type DNA-binding protein